MSEPPAYLAFTRRYGWIVVVPNPKFGKSEEYYAGVQAFSRPGGVNIRPRDVLARAELPPPPENAA